MMQPIIDMHNHIFTSKENIRQYADTAERLGIVKIVVLGLEWPGSNISTNDQILYAIKEYPDLFVGFAGLNYWDEIDADKIDRFKDQGFHGLKFILPPEPYNSERFYTYYERAEKLNMPSLFHLGIIAREPSIACRVDNSLMRPVFLDTIARDFENLTVMGAHLGNPWYEEATMSARWNPNLFFDLSGSILKKKSPEFLGSLLWWNDTTDYGSPKWDNAWEQIVFGTDVLPEKMGDLLDDYTNVFDTLGLSEELRRKVLFETGADILRKAGVEV